MLDSIDYLGCRIMSKYFPLLELITIISNCVSCGKRETYPCQIVQVVSKKVFDSFCAKVVKHCGMLKVSIELDDAEFNMTHIHHTT